MIRVLGESLRRRAERLADDAAAAGEVRQLLQELCAHQSQLETQNDELREAQRATELSRRQYLQLFESVPAACLTRDADGVVGAVNRRAEQLFAAGRRRLRGRPLLSLAADGCRDRLDVYLAEMRHGQVGRQEFRFLRADGSVFDGLLDGSAVRDPVGGGLSLLCSVVDVSERNEATRALEAATRQLELALAAKTRFLAAASHDLRQPVQALSLFVDVLGQQVLPPTSQSILTRVREAVGSLGGLLNGLLDISKLEAGLVAPEPGEFEAAELMRRLGSEFQEMARAKDLRFRLRPVAARLRSDPDLVERILRNVLGNAVRYTNRGGVLFGARRRGGVLRFEVWDSGVGIPADQIGLIFEDFHQVGNSARNRGEGLGLGLAIVARLSRLLNCRVDVRSHLGRGSCFMIEIPLAGDLRQDNEAA